MKNSLKYRAGYKYQVADAFKTVVDVHPPGIIHTQYAKLHPNGLLEISAGYAWDGPSGPTIDSKNFMRGSLVHDVLYQMMREELLEPEWRAVADLELYRHCRADGMWLLRAWCVWLAVHVFAKEYAHPDNAARVYTAP